MSRNKQLAGRWWAGEGCVRVIVPGRSRKSVWPEQQRFRKNRE